MFSYNRDTPHHLKNKRVQHGVQLDKQASEILANALKNQEKKVHQSNPVKSPILEVAENKEHLQDGKS